MARIRRILVSAHKWIGLILAVFLLLQAISGVLLIYRAEIVDFFAGNSTSESQSDNRRVDLAFILASSEQHYPARDVTRVDFPGSEPGIYLLYLNDRQSGAVTHVVMDSTTGAFSEPVVVTVMHWLFEWHHEYFAGRTGSWFVGAVGVFLMTGLITGIIIWWPGARRVVSSLRVSVKGPAARTLFELHRSVGVVAAAGLLIIASTGALLAFSPTLRPMFGVEAVKPVTTPDHADIKADIKSVTPDRLLAIAQRQFTDGRVKDVRFRQPGNLLERVMIYRKGDTGAKPMHQVWLDPYRGEVIARKDSRQLAANEAFFAWMYPLHTRLGSSGPGRILVFLSGLALITLTALGVLLWAKRRAIRVARRARVRERQRGELDDNVQKTGLQNETDMQSDPIKHSAPQ